MNQFRRARWRACHCAAAGELAMIRRSLSLEQSKVVPLDLGRHDASHQQGATRRLVRIHVLGSMRATTYLGGNILPRGKKARAVLGYLSLAGGEPVPRGRLAAMLWDRVSDAHARTSFRQALRELAAAMGPLANELISAERETVRLDNSLCWIDAAAVLSPETESANSSRSDLVALCTG